MTQEKFEKGEVRFLFKSGDKINFVKAEAALPFIKTVMAAVEGPGLKKGAWEPSKMSGWDTLEATHQKAMLSVFKASTGDALPSLVKAQSPSSSSKKRSRSQTAAPRSGGRGRRKQKAEESSDGEGMELDSDTSEPVSTSEASDDEESSDGEEAGGEVPKEVVWARQVGSPYWPAAVCDPVEEEQKAAKRARHKFVIFYGAKPRTWAWVADANVKAFVEQGDGDAPVYNVMPPPKAKSQQYLFRRAVSQAMKAAGIEEGATPKGGKQATPLKRETQRVAESPVKLSDYELRRLEAIRRNQVNPRHPRHTRQTLILAVV